MNEEKLNEKEKKQIFSEFSTIFIEEENDLLNKEEDKKSFSIFFGKVFLYLMTKNDNNNRSFSDDKKLKCNTLLTNNCFLIKMKKLYIKLSEIDEISLKSLNIYEMKIMEKNENYPFHFCLECLLKLEGNANENNKQTKIKSNNIKIYNENCQNKIIIYEIFNKSVEEKNNINNKKIDKGFYFEFNKKRNKCIEIKQILNFFFFF